MVQAVYGQQMVPVILTARLHAKQFTILAHRTSKPVLLTFVLQFCPRYQQDIETGIVNICLAVLPTLPQQDTAIDCITLTIVKSPSASAGINTTICDNETYTLTGATASNYEYIEWGTTGDGSFDNVNVINPTYMPGESDINIGSTELCLTAFPNDPCYLEVVDCINLTLIDGPYVTLADTMKLSCSDYNTNSNVWNPVELEAIIVNSTSILWETNGDGTFDDPGIHNPIYTFGVNDNSQGIVELCVYVEGDGCQFVAEKCVQILIPQQMIVFTTDGWHGVSSYLQPYKPSMIDVMQPLVQYPGSNNLVMIINEQNEYYWPEPSTPVNQIGDWGPVGYKAKMKNIPPPACLPIYGDYLEDQSFIVDGSFTYLPVLTNIPTNIEELLGDEISNVLMIYDWSNGHFWTPVAHDFDELLPGKSYLLVSRNAGAEYIIEFPEYELNAPLKFDATTAETDISSPWNDIETTSQNHFFLFADEAITILQAGDIIGAFNKTGHCLGIAEFAGRDSFFKLTAMGDDPNTPEIDGFETGEYITFKLYRKATGQTFEIAFTCDTEYPNHDGLFSLYGVSRVIEMTIGASSINAGNQNKGVKLFPNPATDMVHIEADFKIADLKLINHTGQIIFNQNVNLYNLHIDISGFGPGMYFLNIMGHGGEIVNKKLTVH
ncbi:MAG: hypothetical protein B6D61_13070 [Bacteroidetes bacterium 4484_249]|nr:MAG: hypothetical protein B6D61_13070 [Bacteroidetes bacterium 4484_249]